MCFPLVNYIGKYSEPIKEIIEKSVRELYTTHRLSR